MIEISVNLEFDDGNFQQGFSNLYLKIDAINSYLHIKPLEVQLSPAPEIPICYQTWKNLYSYFTNSRRAFKEKPTNVSRTQHEEQLKKEEQQRQQKAEEYRQQIEYLRQSLNQWLEPIKYQLKAVLPDLQQPNQEAEVHLIIHTHKIKSDADKNILHRLPWQDCNLFPQETTSEVALCLEHSQFHTANSPELSTPRKIRRVKIISIFGNTDNGKNEKINTQVDESLIKDLKKKGAEIEILENPVRGDFIKLWEVPCDILFFAGHSHSQEVRSVSFSPDGKVLASANADGTVQLWDIASDKANWRVIIILTLGYGYSADTPVNSVRFSFDGKTIISAHDDGQFILWDFDLNNLLVRRCVDLRRYIDNNLDNQRDKSNPQESKADKPVVDIRDKDLCKGIGDKPKR